jgi:tRNA wybutosine-synthesizing protein 1
LILNEAIAAQRKLLSGFKANPQVSGKLFEESTSPMHVAISLDGEPTLYPRIADLIREISQRGMTSFLVTNGTMPNRLEDILNGGAEPTNLYLSLYGPGKTTYEKVTRPLVPDVWERIRTSIRLLREFKRSRTVVRLTLVKGANMHDPEGYSRLVNEGTPSTLELKGYSWLGESKHRLPMNAMPYQFEIRQFAKKMEKTTGYEVVAEDSVSRVVLLTRDGSVSGLSLDNQ